MAVDRHAGHRIPIHPPKTSSSVPYDDWYPPPGGSADRTPAESAAGGGASKSVPSWRQGLWSECSAFKPASPTVKIIANNFYYGPNSQHLIRPCLLLQRKHFSAR